MTAAPDIDETGPIDYLVIEFPPDRAVHTGEMAAELARLQEAGVIRVLDLVMIEKRQDGSVEGFEIDASTRSTT